MPQNGFVYLVCRELSGALTAEERQQLKDMLKQDALLYEKYKVFQKMHTQQEKDQQPDVENALKEVWEQLRNEKTEITVAPPAMHERKHLFSVRFASIAAAIILLAGIGTAYFLLQQKAATANTAEAVFREQVANLSEKQNTKGIRSSIVLSDGSKIWLNADSKLEYPDVFEGKTREVYLSGEAFFEVAKNPARPFIIHLDGGTVRVLGTSFNIKAYKGSRVIETSVATGRVAFIPEKKNRATATDTTFLTHDVKAVYSMQTGELKTRSTASTDDKAWTEGELIFKALTLDEIATELERTFGKKVVFTNEGVKQYRLTGAFENNSLEEILYYLSLSKPFTYKITDEEIVIGK